MVEVLRMTTVILECYIGVTLNEYTVSCHTTKFSYQLELGILPDYKSVNARNRSTDVKNQ